MGNKNRVAYAICSAHGVDTSGMSPKEAWEKAKEVADKDEMADLEKDGGVEETKEEQKKSEKVDYNAKRMGKEKESNEEADEISDDEINESLMDYTWQITQNTTVGQYAEETAKRLGTTKERVLSQMDYNGKKLSEDEKLFPYVFGDEEDLDDVWKDNPKDLPSPYGAVEPINKKPNHKSESRKDKYGNPLVSDEAFNIGVKAAKDYIEESSKYGYDHNKLKSSNIYVGALQEAISNAIEEAGLNPDYDLTYQDFNEIIGAATGDEIDIESDEYDSKLRSWTGKKYGGYQPKVEDEPIDYNALRTGKISKSSRDSENSPKEIDYENVNYPNGTSKKYTKFVNEKFESSKPILEKAGIKLEDFGGKPSKEGGYEDNTKEIMNKYVFEPFRKKYPNGNNAVWEKEYQPLFDAIESVADKNYNDWYILNK